MLLFLLYSTAFGLVVCQQDSNEVAFSAGLTHDIAILHAEKVVYDKVFTNVGGGYDNTSGNFNCPVSGVYVFQFHALAHQDKSTWLELYHNAYYIASIYGHTVNDYASGGNSVILKLSKGDQVYVKAVDNSYGTDTNMYGRPDEIYSTFSGYLIAPIYEEIPTVG
ncbi:complement C1q-like protein 4 [Mercenaria mercenaria]|uniref:complement C1q-like protein 4 n=1 Tax=Mercenaria mercenaria TaxID=6596 RepID=UPI001E1D3231|nr:complement C1q-like protein 4 [Mercenaria mercenaria]XP_045177711.1 complement C1q-like protein 4 [Mercenaria mercenaria]